MDRLFTREEAEALLPTLLPQVERLRDLARDLRTRQAVLLEYHRHARGNGRDAPADEFERKKAEIEELESLLRQELSAVTELGVEVKDLEMGLLDFPSLREGRIVYLCWKLGETSVAYWHDLDTGYPGRQPL